MLIMRQYLLMHTILHASVGSEYTILGTKSTMASIYMPPSLHFKDTLYKPIPFTNHSDNYFVGKTLFC